MSTCGGVQMSGFLGFIRQHILRLGRDRSGNISQMFAISIVPLIVAVGAAVDYTRIASVRNKLDNAADVATLASISKDAQPFTNTPTQASVQKIFNVAAASVTIATVTSFTATITPGATQLTVTVNYTATVPLVFGAFLGESTATVSGTSTAAVNA